MSLDYEFAPIDVLIIVHQRVNKIPESRRFAAFGLWCWGQCFTKLARTKGRLSMADVRSALGINGESLAKHLIDVGLWLPVQGSGDVEIFNWERKGPGRSGPKELSASAVRMRRKRELDKQRHEASLVTSRDASPPSPVTSRDASHSDVTLFSSGSDLSSSLSDESPSGDVRPCAAEPLPEPTESPNGPWPPWFDDVLSTLAMQVEPIEDPASAWLRYEGHRAAKVPPKPTSGPDARYWLSGVVIPEQRERREKARAERARHDERTAVELRRNRPPEYVPPPEPTERIRPMTAAELDAALAPTRSGPRLAAGRT